MNNILMNKIQNAEIDIPAYKSIYKASSTNKDKYILYNDLLTNGLIVPIVLTEDSNNNVFIVDGNIRYKLIRQFKKQNIKFHFPIPLTIIDINLVDKYYQTKYNFNINKQYTKLQLAIFMAYHYWDIVQKESRNRQLSGGKIGKKGKTSAIIGNMIGVNEKYIYWANQLLKINPYIIYKTFYTQRYNLTVREIKELLSMNTIDINKLLNKIQVLNIYPSSNNCSFKSLNGSIPACTNIVY